jgi:hypothetical protein
MKKYIFGAVTALFVGFLFMPLFAFAAYSWTERQPAGAADKSWGEGDVSGSGSIMMVAVGDSPTAAGSSGRVYLSTNAGVSWAETRPAGNTDTSMKVRISTDGSLFMAGQDQTSSPGRLYVSTTTGSSWTETQPAGVVNRSWRALATDSDGSVLIAGANGGRIYISTTTSNTWSEVQPAGNVNAAWYSAATDSDGSVMLVGVNSGRLYLSTNTGDTWSEVQPAGDVTRQWFSLASDSDGSVLFAASGGGAGTRRLYLSTNTGSTWSEVQPAGATNKNWASVDVSSDGSVLIATVIGGRVYFSDNTGNSWTETQPAGAADKSWTIGAMSSNGAVFLAGAFFGRIYTGAVIDVTPPSLSSLSPMDDAVNVPIDSNLTITFNEDIATSTGNVVIYDAADDSIIETIDIASAQITTLSSTSLAINPSITLLNNKSYYITIDAGSIKDIATNSYAGISDSTTWNFSTPILPFLTVTVSVINDNGGTAVAGDFDIFLDALELTSGDATTTDAGTHTVSQTPDVDYTTTIAGDCASDGTITMELAGTYTCTITNDDIAVPVVEEEDSGAPSSHRRSSSPSNITNEAPSAPTLPTDVTTETPMVFTLSIAVDLSPEVEAKVVEIQTKLIELLKQLLAELMSTH